MEQVRLGSTGMKVSRLCFGCMTYGDPGWREWVLTEDEGRPFLRRAMDLGITFFDTADMYSLGVSEEILGRAVRDFGRRDDLVIATKVYNAMGPGANQRGLSRKHILSGIEGSLKRLGTDYVDLYIIHRFDYETPIEEVCEALDAVVRSGKARYIGASSMFAWQFMKMLAFQEANGLARFVSMQNHYNLIYREEEREMLPLCRSEGIAVTPWSPLARGMLAGSRKAQTARSGTDTQMRAMYVEPQDEAIVDAVAKIAAERGVAPAQIALAWLMSRPGVTAPIIGASKPHHLEDAVAALSITLSEEEVQALEAPYRPRAVAGHS